MIDSKIINSLIYSLNGLRICFREKSFLLEIFFLLTTSLILYLIDSSVKSIIIYLLSCIVLLAFEAFNTALEKICNRITTDYDEEIGIVKDISSAAVFLILIINLVLFFSIAWGYI